MTDQSNKIASCPFCKNVHANVCCNLKNRTFVVCGKCHAQGPSVGYTKGQASAIEEWNRAPRMSVIE